MNLTTALFLVMNSIRIYAIYLFIDTFLYEKRTAKGALLSAYFAYFAITSYFFLLHFNILTNLILNLTGVFLIGLLYRDTYKKRMLGSVFMFVLSIASENTIGILQGLIFNTSFSDVINNTTMSHIGIIASVLFFLVTILLIKPLFQHKKEAQLPPSYWLAIFLIPSCSILLIQTLITNLYAEEDLSLPIIGFIFLILLAINILVFFLYNKLIAEEAIKHENTALSLQNEAYENQALLIQDIQNKLSGQRHDYKQHLASLKTQLQRKEFKKLSEYIDTLLDDYDTIKSDIHTGNTAIDAMMNSKLFLASGQNIIFHENIKLYESVDINPVDLTIILGNLLDNSMEACAKITSGERIIWVDIIYQHSVLSLHISNTYNKSQIDMRGDKAYTTKEDKASHGIGLTRVKQAVEKYKGIFEYETSRKDDMDIFETQIMIYL